MTEYFPAFRPGDLENDVAEMRRRVKAVLTRAGVLVEFRPHRPTVERFASLAEGNGHAVSTVDVAEFTLPVVGPAHVVLFDTGDEYAVSNLLGAYAQLRGRLDHVRWLWTTRGQRIRSNGAVVTTLAVRDEHQAAALALQVERLAGCPGDADIRYDFLTGKGGHLAACDHCHWQGPTHGRVNDALRDAIAHNAPAAIESAGGAR